ncbi:MAG: hypothetical protein Q4A13_06835, partial [Fretibacterium sp.]|nr:hypothetical protein [Fretibacterium sp.]
GLRLTFRGGDWFRTAVPCLTDLWIALEDRSGTRHAARALVHIRKSSAQVARAGGGRSACDCA